MAVALALLLSVLGLVGADLVQGADLVLGADLGTESVRVGLFTADGRLLGEGSAAYATCHPQPGFVEQSPEDWWECLGRASRSAMTQAGAEADRVRGVAVDTTACSVVLLDQLLEPLAPCILYCDSRSAAQSRRIVEAARGDPALRVCSDGRGPVSAEWMLPKCLWVKEHRPDLWSRAFHVCEKNDFINARLTGVLTASGCNVAARWNWDAEEATREGADHLAGRPVSLLRRLGLEELLSKWPQRCVPMGSVIGPLTEAAARHLGLTPGIAVTQGGPDAYVGMVGLGCVVPGRMALITGSTHLHLCVSTSDSSHPGLWGPYRGAPLRGLSFVEGGQSSTGSLLAWARRLLSNGAELSYTALDEEASRVPVGADGLLCLETFQGSRTPKTDPLARGAFAGLSLFHTRGHIWRAILEGVCLGTRSCVAAMEEAGYKANEVHLSGGVSRSTLWLQMHADAIGKPVIVGEHENCCLLGSAVLAAVGAGLHASLVTAVEAMVRVSKRIEPNPSRTKEYSLLHENYNDLTAALGGVSHDLATKSYRGGNPHEAPTLLKRTIVAPSILAADFQAIGEECKMCMKYGCSWIHLDIFDGSKICQGSFSFGPTMVARIHQRCPDLKLDAHIAVADPSSIIEDILDCGVSRVTLQLEMFNDTASVVNLLKNIRNHSVDCALCIAPSTPVASLIPFLEEYDDSGAPLVRFVNILAVTPGIGGQSFNSTALDKIRELKKRYGSEIRVAVDGGVNATTARACVQAGADVLIAGTSLFGRSRDSTDPMANIVFRENLVEICKAIT